MKRLLSTLALVLVTIAANAAFVKHMPVQRLQPNGDTLHCLVTGDEYYHRYHDANEFTIVQDPSTGYWVYADTIGWANGEGWDLVPTALIPGRDDPKMLGLSPYLTICREQWNLKQKFYDIPEYARVERPKTSGTNHGTLNNVVIFIRFAGESEISTSFNNINAMFNDSSANSTSMYTYFRHASYNKLSIVTHYYPTPNGNSVLSYQDSHPRNYYQPYDATSNPTGYVDDDDHRNREFTLLQNAVNYINANSPVPTSLNIDNDNDGYIDNVCFVVKGTYTGWNELLWPHKWALYDRNVYINGKRVYTFNLQLEGSGVHYFSSSTFSHEMFHTLGAPDLYHYYVETDISPVANWDLMGSNTTPPQHMGAYMKYRYGNWMDSIPEITVPGTYSLRSIADPENVNNCYRIAAQEPNQWYVLEYRDNDEMFETALPGKGLLIYRIDGNYSGNASYDGTTYFDEVYLFRPGGNDHSTNGTTATAYFSGNTNRTSFTPSTNPHPWCSGNIIDTTFGIINIGVPGDSIVFTYVDMRGCRAPSNQATSNLTGTSAQVVWNGNGLGYQVEYRTAYNGPVNTVSTTACNTYLVGLSMSTTYQWRVRSICDAGDTSGWSEWAEFRTPSCMITLSDTTGTADQQEWTLPINTYYNYSYNQMIYTPAEVGGAKEINKLAFSYSGSTPSTSKTDCTIYLGQTNINSFTGSAVSDLIPFNTLQQVFQGDMNCVQGWNEFVLDTPFAYDGNSNLVVVIDDNSGEYDGNTYTFDCTQTGNRYTSITYYSDNYNFDPAQDNNYAGSKYRRMFHPDMQFVGCPDGDLPTHNVAVVNEHPSWGIAVGEGTYVEGQNATLTALPDDHSYFQYWLTGTDTITENPYTFQVTEDKEFVVNFGREQHSFELRGEGFAEPYATIDTEDGAIASAGNYDHGTVLVLHSGTSGGSAMFVSWNDGNTDDPRTITLTQDTVFTASYEWVGIIENDEALNITIVARGGQVQVNGLEGRKAMLFDLEGRMLGQCKDVANAIFEVTHAGVFLLQVDGEPARKVVVLK